MSRRSTILAPSTRAPSIDIARTYLHLQRLIKQVEQAKRSDNAGRAMNRMRPSPWITGTTGAGKN
jgi:hypothetical protein